MITDVVSTTVDIVHFLVSTTSTRRLLFLISRERVPDDLLIDQIFGKKKVRILTNDHINDKNLHQSLTSSIQKKKIIIDDDLDNTWNGTTCTGEEKRISSRIDSRS